MLFRHLAVLALILAAFGGEPPAATKPEPPPLQELTIAGVAGVMPTEPDYHWPVQFYLPRSLGGSAGIPVKGKGQSQPTRPKPDIAVWFPPEARHIRAMLLIPNNSDSVSFGTWPALREVAVKREMAVVYLRRFDTAFEHRAAAPDKDTVAILLPIIAELTRIPDFIHAPWVTFGKSSRGEFPFRMSWLHPGRTIASVTYHGETPTWPMLPWAKGKEATVLHVNVNGETEWMGTWYRHVRPCLLNYRAQTAWLPHQAIAYGIDHGDYSESAPTKEAQVKASSPNKLGRDRVFNYLARFVDKALALRVPTDAYPTTGPIALKQVDPDQGWLIHPRAAEELLKLKWRPLRSSEGVYQIVDHKKEPTEVYAEQQGTVDPALLIRKAADVPAAERRDYFWVADQEQAEAWRALHTRTPVAPVDPAAPAEAPVTKP